MAKNKGNSKKEIAKTKRGRPSKYPQVNLKQAELLAGKGFIDKEIAQFFGISEATVNNYKKEHPEFLESLKKGKFIADKKVTDSLFKRCTGFRVKAVKIFNNNGQPLQVDYREYYPPDTTSCIFWLKNRRPDLWKDKQEVNHSGNITLNVSPDFIPKDEFDES